MAAPVIDQGVVIGVLVAQLSIDEVDRIVTSNRRWRHEGLGATGEATLTQLSAFILLAIGVQIVWGGLRELIRGL